MMAIIIKYLATNSSLTLEKLRFDPISLALIDVEC